MRLQLRPPLLIYLLWYVLLLTQSIGTKSDKCKGYWFYMVPEMYILDPENHPVMWSLGG